MAAVRARLGYGDGSALILGVVATLVASMALRWFGPVPTLGGILAVAAFAAFVGVMLSVPHVGFAVIVPVFVVLPAVKTLALPAIGPLKDGMTIATGVAVAGAVIARGAAARRFDRWTTGAVVGLLALYVLNVGGGLGPQAHDAAWAHGVRLVAEPLILLLAGMTLGDGARTLRWTMASVLVTGVAVAMLGIAQQLVGQWRLVELGYSFDDEVRTINGHLRSFGTMDDPFAYAAFLFFPLVATAFWLRPRWLAGVVAPLLVAGIAAGLVRSALLPALALVGLVLARKGRSVVAVFVLAAAAVAGVTTLGLLSGASETRTVQTGPATYLTLNGRTDAWSVVLKRPADWPLGLGVGEVGTAAQRASYALVRAEGEESTVQAVDSGYFATMADVGLAGLALLLLLFGRLAVLAARGAQAGATGGWLALGFLAVILLDATTRDSFTGFPTAFLGMLLIGVSLRACADRRAERGVRV